MKQSSDFNKAQKNMAPGVLTADGFLGSDTRNIVDIVEADQEALAKLGITLEQILERLKFLKKEGEKGLGEPVSVAQTWLVRVDETRGTLPCPWEDGIFHKVNCEVTHQASGERIVYNDLILHLLEVHGFFQGKGSSFRLDPEALKRVLLI